MENRAETDAGRRNRKKMMLIAAAVILISLALLSVAVAVLKQFDTEDPDPGIPEYDFRFEPVYDGDILACPEYLALYREVRFCESPNGYGQTVSVNDSNLDEFEDGVRFLYGYLQTVIRGDAEAYNACFSDAYFRTHEKTGAFAQQMVYDAEIYRVSSSSGGGISSFTYYLEYKIHRNNGTFRRDVESDASRRQTVIVSVDGSGVCRIESLTTQHLIQK